MLFKLWSNKYNKWWRAGAWGYSEDFADAGHFSPTDAFRFLINGVNDPLWTSQNDEPKTIALGEDGRWYSLVEYEGPLPDGGTPIDAPEDESVHAVARDGLPVRHEELRDAA